jgi:uncharacterized protein (DUF2236 family)
MVRGSYAPQQAMTVLPSEAEAERLLVGPESIAWRRASDVRLFFVMLYPLLLQVAHPVVGAGVSDFSDFERHPWRRLLGTLDWVTLLVYGGRAAIPAGRRLRELHRRIRGVRPDGRPYSALEPQAYAWVHATLIEAYVAGHRHFGTPLSAAERESFYREYRGLGRLCGVREQDLPPGWESFRRYFDDASELLEPTEAVFRVLETVRRAPPPPLWPRLAPWRAVRWPAAGAVWLGGVGLLGPRLRARLGIPFSGRDELAFRALGRLSRSLDPLLGESLRVVGPAQLRMRRRAIARGPLGSGSPAWALR